MKHFHPEDLADPAVALFRTWIISRFANSADTAKVSREP
jgi:hypothetical protein